MQRIIVSVTNDLVTDQRVHKVCSTLVVMGYEVLLIGRKLPTSLTLNRTYKTYRMKLFFNKGFLFYAEYNTRLFFKLLFLKKDVLLSNDLDTLLPNFLISKLLDKKIVYDSHELFTEIPELIHRPRVQKIWLQIEKFILPKLKNCYTVSNSIANYYKKKYGVEFSVIRNVPYLNDSNFKTSFAFNDVSSRKRIILYQGSINIGRGLELMIEAIQYIDDALFIVIGGGDILDKLKLKTKNLELNDYVTFLNKVPPSQLKELTSLANVGISLEEDMGLNYRFALPNKLFDFIQAKVPVVVSNLPEMKRIVEEYNVGKVLNKRTPKHLAKILTKILEEGKKPWQESLNLAAKELNWENEEVKLKTIFNNLN